MIGLVAVDRQQSGNEFVRQVGIGHKGDWDAAPLELLIKSKDRRVCVTDILFGCNFFCVNGF